MTDPSKTGQELLKELDSLRERVAELEQAQLQCRQVEKRLRESEEQFRSIFDNSLDAIMLTKPTGEIVAANRAAQTLLGMSEEEIRGGGRAGMVVADEALTAALEARETAGRWRGTLTYRRKDGSTFPVDVSSNVFGGPDGRAMTIVIFRDIAERMRLEEELRLSVRKYRDIFEHVPIGLYQVSPEGRFIRANDHAARILGYDSPEELMDTVTDISTQIYVDPSRRNEVVRLLTENGSIENFEVEFRHKDGTPVWVSINAKVVGDGQGNVLYHEGVSQDITQRKKAENALQESESRFRLFMDNSPTIAWIKDAQGRYIYLSRTCEERYGAGSRDWIGKTDEEIWPPEVAAMYRANDRVVLETGRPVTFTEESVSLEGSRSCWLNCKFPFRASGKPYVAGIGLDITEQKKAEDEVAVYRERLEDLVKERTRELEEKTYILEELNAATRVLLRQREEDRKELEGRFVANMKNLILPYAEKLKSTRLDERQRSYLAIMETHLDEILSPLVKTMQRHNLTPTESQVASLI
ncbi:MAG: PAS domain-containing protein, partial [Deltaproteobacteria bacterium]|nr:PAS domain-containing protein [Deltaproteobacteria bacterium]